MFYNPTEEEIHYEVSKLAKQIYQDNPNQSDLDNRLYAEKEYWLNISKYQKLSEDFIEKHKNKVDWRWISIYQKLSEDFIEKHKDKVDWNQISCYQKLSEEFIERNKELVDWNYISKYQKLNEPFIEKHKKLVDWYYISQFQKLSEEFRRKYNLEIPKNNWLYASKQDKINYIKENTNYEIINDEYILAYKSTKHDGYSMYNFQYKYEVGQTYEAYCDCNLNNENSFGLSAWTKEGALEYYDKGELYLVKILIDDIGAIVHDGNKIRAFKIEVMEKIQ